MSKHTPAPWVLEFGAEPGSWEIYAANAIVVAARSRWSHRADESNANARLIAAAPELLEEHRRTLRAFEELDGVLERCGFSRAHRERLLVTDGIAATRKVIAKAEGTTTKEKK